VVVVALVRESGPAPVLVPAALLLVAVGLGVHGYVRTSRLAPPGTVLGAALGPRGLHLRGPVVPDAAMGYHAFRTVVVRGQWVVLELRVARRVTALPLALFPGPVLDELRERVRSAAGPGQEPVTPGPGPGPGRPAATSYTTDEGYVGRLAQACFRQLVVTPPRVAVIVLVITGGALLTGDGLTTGLLVALVVLVVMAVVFRRVYGQLRRKLAAQVPVGTVYQAVLDGDRLWLAGPVMTFEQSCTQLVAVRTRGEFVFLQQRATQGWVVFPVQLFPGGTLDDLRERVAGSR